MGSVWAWNMRRWGLRTIARRYLSNDRNYHPDEHEYNGDR